MKISKQGTVGEILLSRRFCLLHQEFWEAVEWLTPEDIILLNQFTNHGQGPGLRLSYL